MMQDHAGANDSLVYVPRLGDAEAGEAAQANYPLWGGGRTLDEHLARTRRLLQEGAAILRYAGVRDAGGELVAALKRYSVLLAVPSAGPPRIVRTIGLGAIFTSERHRRRGAATFLIRRVLDEARTEGFEAALLYSDIDPGFYARLGFRSFPAVNCTVAVSQLPEASSLTARPAGPLDEDRLLDWYARAFPPESIRPARTLELWRFFRTLNAGGLDYVLSDGDQDVGYLHARTGGSALWLEEWAAPGVEERRVLGAARAVAVSAGASVVRGWPRLDQLGPGVQVDARSRAIPMVADLAGALGLAAIDPAASRFGSLDHF